MLHAAVVAVFAAIALIHIPVERGAWTLLAEVTGKGTNVEEANKGEELADTILQWCS